MNEAYTISNERLNAITEAVYKHNAKRIKNGGKAVSGGYIRPHLLADWPEEQAHQDWLNNADVQEIAEWIISCHIGEFGY